MRRTDVVLRYLALSAGAVAGCDGASDRTSNVRSRASMSIASVVSDTGRRAIRSSTAGARRAHSIAHRVRDVA
jgi:hypothetical protein